MPWPPVILAMMSLPQRMRPPTPAIRMRTITSKTMAMVRRTLECFYFVLVISCLRSSGSSSSLSGSSGARKSSALVVGLSLVSDFEGFSGSFDVVGDSGDLVESGEATKGTISSSDLVSLTEISKDSSATMDFLVLVGRGFLVARVVKGSEEDFLCVTGF